MCQTPLSRCGHRQGGDSADRSVFPVEQTGSVPALCPCMRRHKGLSPQSVEHLDDADLLSLLLSNGRDDSHCRQIASLLLEDFGGLRGLWRIALEGSPCLGEQRSLRLAAAFEVGVRCLESRTKRKTVSCSADISELLGPRLSRCLNEQVWLVALDSRNRVLAHRRVAEGGLHGCALLPADVLRVAVSLGASAFILVHNHPGGDATPSCQDLQLTRRLSQAGLCVGVPLLDHVIIAGHEHRSVLDLGILQKPEAEETCTAADQS